MKAKSSRILNCVCIARRLDPVSVLVASTWNIISLKVTDKVTLLDYNCSSLNSCSSGSLAARVATKSGWSAQPLRSPTLTQKQASRTKRTDCILLLRIQAKATQQVWVCPPCPGPWETDCHLMNQKSFQLRFSVPSSSGYRCKLIYNL